MSDVTKGLVLGFDKLEKRNGKICIAYSNFFRTTVQFNACIIMRPFTSCSENATSLYNKAISVGLFFGADENIHSNLNTQHGIAQTHITSLWERRNDKWHCDEFHKRKWDSTRRVPCVEQQHTTQQFVRGTHDQRPSCTMCTHQQEETRHALQQTSDVIAHYISEITTEST